MVDQRRHYRETRFRAVSFIHHRLHVMVFCFRENAIRLISLRKANTREVLRYDQTQARHPATDA